jgi:hypothetical protein
VSNGLKPIQAIGNQLESGLIKLASVKRQQCGLLRHSDYFGLKLKADVWSLSQQGQYIKDGKGIVDPYRK